MSSVLPPSYSSSPPPPVYSNIRLKGEETIEFTPRGNAPSTVSVNLTKTCSFLTIVLQGQNVAEDYPTYGRGSTLCGEIELKSNASVLSVSVKLKGRLHVSISDSGSTTVPVVSETVVLWSQASAHGGPCPKILPFSMTFPTTFEHAGRIRPIPPSFCEAFYQLPAASAQCTYMLKVTIHSSGSKVAFWRPSRSYSMQLNYRPRTRPPRPIFHMDRFLTTLKHIPEDWLEIESTMRTRRTASSDFKPISCRFFLPSVRAFGLSDSIPFHIQLSTSLASLRLLLPDAISEAKQSSSIRVFITRQTMVEVNTRKCWRTATLVEGTVRAVAPPVDSASVEGNDVYVDWEGEVRVEKDVVQSGGFNIGTVFIKDYIVFALTPPNPRSCPLLAHQYSQPIKLVTEAWTDDFTSHPSDTSSWLTRSAM
ncbi:hypothetical protein J3R30DRAFT_3833865 [Lentinula aciculospora]|uniref:Arrestin-like N-terminal domain-containing protein n=1 Tax=Lentinula aciculospora TaxID=153920 RepID=A0A9W9AK19_9AGAR|nr:hypothetical protein J3R30DRAFT_3833865 [Lentinula aciculospora]